MIMQRIIVRNATVCNTVANIVTLKNRSYSISLRSHYKPIYVFAQLIQQYKPLALVLISFWRISLTEDYLKIIFKT